VAGPPLAALGGGVLTRHSEHLARGEALTSGILNDAWIEHLGPADLPRPTAREAGRTLASIAASADLTLFAHYATDTAGHTQEMAPAVSALERVDVMLAGVMDALPEGHRVMIISDHGNLEDARVGHTRNPALGVVVDAVGGTRAADVSEEMVSLMDVPETVLGLLARTGPAPHPLAPRPGPPWMRVQRSEPSHRG